MRRAPHSLFVAVLAAGLLLGGAARAQRGIDVETFRPSVDGFGLYTVERAETSKQFDFGFKLVVDYAHAPLMLPMKKAATDTSPAKLALMRWQVAAHVGLHVGLTDWLELALDVPISEQRYDAAYGLPLDDAVPGGPAPTGFYAAEARTNVPPPNASPLDPRVALKLRTRRFGPLGLALVLGMTVPFGDDSAFAGDTGFTFRPNAVVDVTSGRFTVALNAGAVVRKQTTVLDPLDVATMSAAPAHLISVGSEITAGLGAGVRATRWLGFSVEGYALVPVTADSGPGAAPKDYVLDVLGGANFMPGSDITLNLGAGGGLLDSRRKDAFRVFAGIAWTPSGRGAGAARVGSAGDKDGDGVPDDVDVCPTEPEDKDGFEDEDGCPDPDNDGDGVPDARDRCPTELEDKDGFEDEDGCPDLDNDKDGIPDVTDKCPDEPEDKDGFEDDDGCPDPDNDADGIPDEKDRCPNEAETQNGIDDDDGCPDTGSGVAPGTKEGGSSTSTAVAIPEVITFGRGLSRMGMTQLLQLQRLAARLKTELGARRLRVSGLADPVERAHDANLSRARAEAVRDELVRLGFDAAKIDVEGRQMEASRHVSSSMMAKARRVDFAVVE